MEKLKIKKRSNIKGEDGYKVFSVRIKDSTVERLEDLSKNTNRSRNESINIILEYGLDNCEIEDDK
ncbi:MAG: CopG family transcriptional regulator [Clostridiales bacterium]|nr:CopG family transcriptional regulator [Clostridiales bacterium]